MAIPVIMPRQGQSVESCIITKWHKKKGDKVKIGDILFSYETDKSAFDEEAKDEGTLLDIFFNEGDDVECLLTVCVIGNEGEDYSAFIPQQVAGGEEKEQVAPKEETKVATEAAVTAAKTDIPSEGLIKASPRAKRLAEKKGLDLRYAVGSGPNGRIIERDVFALENADIKVAEPVIKEEVVKQAAPVTTTAPLSATEEYEDVAMPNIRKVIAKAMTKSLTEAAQLTLNSSFDATEILAFRAELKQNGEQLELEKITLNDIVLYAVAQTLMLHKDVNANILGDTMRYFKTVNLGVAVDTPRGLLVPVIKGAEKLSLNELSKKAKGLIKGAQSGTVNPDDLSGGSFTVTNLGSLGVESFTPVINPPQTAILGVDNIQTKIKMVDGQPVFYQAMGLSLTFDHRAMDGAPAAKFLKDVCYNLEHFSLLLAK